MGLDYVDVTPAHLPALQKLLLRYWERDWSSDVAERFLKWRFLDRPEWEAVAAFDGEECVACIDSFVRPYLLNGKQVRVRESCDWICLPEHRPFVGLRVLQAFMKKPEPLITTTSSEDNDKLLNGLRWRTLGELEQWVFPIGMGAVAKTVVGRLNKELGTLPALTGKLMPFRFRKPRQLPAPAEPAAIIELGAGEPLPAMTPPNDAFSLCALADARDIPWFEAAPQGEGAFLWLLFKIGDEPIGLSLSRLYWEGPYLGAKLLHLQSTRHDQETYAWLLSGTSRHLAERGAHWIDARFSCAPILRALEAVGYMRSRSWAVYWWSRDHSDVEGAIHATGMRGVEGIMPYPYDSEAVLRSA